MTPQRTTGCSKRPFSAAAASEEAKAYPLRYVEPLSDARTKLEAFFNILLENSPFIGIVAESIHEVTVTGSEKTIPCNLLPAFPDLTLQDVSYPRVKLGRLHVPAADPTIPVVCGPWSGAMW
jgi:hypothetical protein